MKLYDVFKRDKESFELQYLTTTKYLKSVFEMLTSPDGSTRDDIVYLKRESSMFNMSFDIVEEESGL